MSMAGSCNLGVRLRTLSCTATVRERSLGHLDRTRQCSSQGTQPSAKSGQASGRRQRDIWSVDRFGRSLQHLVGFLEELEGAGCDLYLQVHTAAQASPAPLVGERYHE